jgi:hypothetical protein
MTQAWSRLLAALTNAEKFGRGIHQEIKHMAMASNKMHRHRVNG